MASVDRRDNSGATKVVYMLHVHVTAINVPCSFHKPVPGASGSQQDPHLPLHCPLVPPNPLTRVTHSHGLARAPGRIRHSHAHVKPWNPLACACACRCAPSIREVARGRRRTTCLCSTPRCVQALMSSHRSAGTRHRSSANGRRFGSRRSGCRRRGWRARAAWSRHHRGGMGCPGGRSTARCRSWVGSCCRSSGARRLDGASRRR